MLESNFNAGETLFFANGATVEQHICMGSFENEDKMNYVITPFGNLNTVPVEKSFKTFEEAKEYIVAEANILMKKAQEQVETVKSISSEDVRVIQNNKPTQEEIDADEQK